MYLQPCWNRGHIKFVVLIASRLRSYSFTPHGKFTERYRLETSYFSLLWFYLLSDPCAHACAFTGQPHTVHMQSTGCTRKNRNLALLLILEIKIYGAFLVITTIFQAFKNEEPLHFISGHLLYSVVNVYIRENIPSCGGCTPFSHCVDSCNSWLRTFDKCRGTCLLFWVALAIL